VGGPLRSLRQISQPAQDVERAVAFYRDVLGLSLIARFGDLAFFDLGGSRLLVSPDAEARTGSVLYFAVQDIDATQAELRGRGVVFEGEAQLIFADTAGTFGPAGEEEWMSFFRDSEGNLLALSARRRSG
jgi:methylmalonyl-CoA/ethylmalonyl-CoA epimerase